MGGSSRSRRGSTTNCRRPSCATSPLASRPQENVLRKLCVPITKHDKLPDIVLYDEKRQWLFLIEAVTSHGPVSPKRKLEMEGALKSCRTERIYVSAFPDFK